MKKWSLSLAAGLTLASAAHAQKLKVPDAPQQQSAPAAQQSQTTIPPAGSAEADIPAVPVAEIIARINDQIISKADLTRASQQMEDEIQQDKLPAAEAEQRRASLLSDLIDQQLLLNRGKEIGVTPDDEVIRRLDQIRKQYNLDTMEDLQKASEQQGVAFEDFKQNIRNGVVTQMVIREEVSRNMHVTSSDAQAYYRKHADQFAVPETVQMSEILIPAGDTDESAAAALEKANKVEDDLKHGSDFAAMAKTVSTGPTAAQGGELGQFKRGQLAKELEDKTFALQAGGYTEPIRTKQGYVILKVSAHTAAGTRPFSEVQDDVSNAVYQERMQPALRAYLTKLREEAFIDIKPGYTDIHASANESKPVFSAYAPPAKKKKAKSVKYRFRNKDQMPATIQPDPQKPNLEQVKAQPGGPTAIATGTYQTAEANPPAQPGATAASAAAANAKAKPARVDNGKTVKVRYGQGQRAAQLPPAPGDSSAAPAATPADAQTTAGNTDVAKLSPESQRILGVQEEKQAKTRYTSRPTVTRAQAKANEEAAHNANAPAPADAEETTTRAVNSQPLGLNGATANPVVQKPTNKERIQAKKEVATQAQPNAGTPGSDTYDADAATKPATTEQTKRHKLLGIL